MMKSFLALFGLICLSSIASAQEGEAFSERLLNGLNYRLEAELSASKGKTPLWLNANRYGLSSLEQTNGRLRGSVERPLRLDSTRKWGFGYGLDAAGAFHYDAKLIVQQAYFEARWLKAVLTVGSKQQPMELFNGALSSGAQTLGINARPVPQVRLALGEYWSPRFTKGWAAIKGHVAYGMYTDKNWQQSFSRYGEQRYLDNILYHSKAGYLRIGNEKEFPATLELGLEMGAQFGGTLHYRDESGVLQSIEGGRGLRDFYHALVPGGADVGETTYQNASGNQLGSWLFRLTIIDPSWSVSFYGDHFFEDHSSMLFLDYDGYGEGDNWNVKEKRRYVLYQLKDFLLGAEVTLKRSRWFRHMVLEYMNTKYQSGPVYHDHTQSISDHVSGRDDYYNHYFYNSWHHWGQVMGNPLYRSPVYNDDGSLRVADNRFKAVHLGIGGVPASNLSYRFLATYQKGYGTYSAPFSDPQHNISLMLEAVYAFTLRGMSGWAVRAAVGMDNGKILGNNYGMQFTLVKSGMLNLKKTNP